MATRRTQFVVSSNSRVELIKKDTKEKFYAMEIYTLVMMIMLERGFHLPLDQYEVYVDGKLQTPSFIDEEI